MNADKTVETLSEKFSNLKAEDLENLDVEELEERLELVNPFAVFFWIWGLLM